MQAQGGPQAHTPTVPLNREEIDKEMERQKEREIRTQFNRFMRFSCPHLLDMQEPLSLEEYRELKKNYTWNQIQDVLVSMENELGLDQRKRSCYQTALAWLKKKTRRAPRQPKEEWRRCLLRAGRERISDLQINLRDSKGF